MATREISYQTGEVGKFSAVDYVLFSGMLIISASIGLFYFFKDRHKSSTKQFLLAGGNMGAIPVGLSLFASFMSAITILGTPAEMYNYGTMYWYISISYIIMIFFAAHVYVPVFYRLKVTSVYEYLQIRFSKGVRTAGAMAFCTQMLLYMAIVLYAPSLALNAVTGFTLWGSIVSVGLICTIYTALGGMKAVLWTDSFQVGVMFTGFLAVVIQGSIEAGGFGDAWKDFSDSGRFILDDFRPDPTVRHTAWCLAIGGAFTWTAIYGTNQAQVQRALTCPTLKTAQIALWLNFVGLELIIYLTSLIGIVIYSFYKNCDPISFELITASDQLLPLFVMDILGHVKGLPGVFVACMFSGALSTISSGLNSLSAVILQDVVRLHIKPNISDENALIVSKVTSFVLGIVCLGLTYIASLMGDTLQAALQLFGMIAGPILGLFTLGMFFPWANTYGAYTGLFSSLIMMFWIGVGKYIEKPPVDPPRPPISVYACNWTLKADRDGVNLTDIFNVTTATPLIEERSWHYPLYTLSYMWYSATAVLWCVVVGLIVSFFTGFNKLEDVDRRTITPIFDILFPCLPRMCKGASKALHCGIDHTDKYAEDDVESENPWDVSIDVITEKKKPDAYHNTAYEDDTVNTKDWGDDNEIPAVTVPAAPKNPPAYDAPEVNGSAPTFVDTTSYKTRL